MTASKKVCHVIQIHIPFSLPLSLSCYRDRERGYSKRDPSPRRKRAPSPPTDQRFEGWPLGRVRQPPQSTRAPRPLLVRGSKAGPSEGFDRRLRPLGLRACWGPSVSEGPQKHDLTMFLKYVNRYLRTRIRATV
jgi:hypothetical protein